MVAHMEGEGDDDNRRRSLRVRIAALAALETGGRLAPNDQALCTVRNVSRTGIGLETGQPPIAGQGVLVRLCIDDVMHELRTRATRVARRGKSNFYDVGLDWSGCSPTQLEFLDQVLQHLEHEPRS
jgi:hypothetical protein